jgi:CheY-like chemotaxis protein/DNA-binding CsgD family transcriptional regulator
VSSESSEIERALRDALTHLHDPDFVPAPPLWRLLGCDAGDGVLALQSALLGVIEGLAPAPDTPPGALARRQYEVLYNRFALGLTQEETADRLHMSLASVRRAQRSATHALARRLWEHQRGREAARSPAAPSTDAGASAAAAGEADWRAQVREELAALRQNAPGAVANVGEIIRSVAELERALASRRGVTLGVEPMPPHLLVAVHPAVLRQVLIMIIGQLVEGTGGGAIRIWAQPGPDEVVVCVAGGPASGGEPSTDLLQAILASQGGSLRLQCAPDGLSYAVAFPRAGDVTLLVVDDNPDMVYFYRRCVEGTRYRIVHESQGRRVFEAVKAHRPDIIVLDIMLPDLDGWQLLAELHHSPATAAIPVLVCSVIREEKLALELGAAALLPKPVSDLEFIQALDRLAGLPGRVGPGAGAPPGPETPARSATAG